MNGVPGLVSGELFCRCNPSLSCIPPALGEWLRSTEVSRESELRYKSTMARLDEARGQSKDASQRRLKQLELRRRKGSTCRDLALHATLEAGLRASSQIAAAVNDLDAQLVEIARHHADLVRVRCPQTTPHNEKNRMLKLN